MRRTLRFTAEADRQLAELERRVDKKGLLGQVRKTLGFLEVNLRHPSLSTHEFQSLQGIGGERVWEAYIQNRTPGAYRIFFHYGPDEGVGLGGYLDEEGGKKRVATLTILAITPHP